MRKICKTSVLNYGDLLRVGECKSDCEKACFELADIVQIDCDLTRLMLI